MKYVHATMAKNIVAMGYPNGRKDAAPAERNISIPLAAKLLGEGYVVYAEPTRSSDSSKERIDLIAANNDFAFAIEMKRRTKNFEGALSDVRRILQFEVQVAPSATSDLACTSAFATAKRRFGLFVSTNFEEQTGFADQWRELPKGLTLVDKYKYLPEVLKTLPQGARFDCTDADTSTQVFARTGAFRLYWILFSVCDAAAE